MKIKLTGQHFVADASATEWLNLNDKLFQNTTGNAYTTALQRSTNNRSHFIRKNNAGNTIIDIDTVTTCTWKKVQGRKRDDVYMAKRYKSRFHNWGNFQKYRRNSVRFNSILSCTATGVETNDGGGFEHIHGDHAARLDGHLPFSYHKSRKCRT